VTASTHESKDRVTVYTIGHSTRSIPEFIAVLASAGVTMVVDVRSLPRSRRHPEYNLDRLPALLAEHSVAHGHLVELGGRRGRSREVPADVNAFWDNQSFHNYADYALSSAFARGLERLIELARQHRCAIMCSEAVWWRCHRRIVADHLLARGHAVIHLMGVDRQTPAEVTPGAVVDGLRVTYPGQAIAQAGDAPQAPP
jgi:uncharacterized protein (DUF488 family)